MKQLLISIAIVLFIILVKKMDIAIVNKQIDNLQAYLKKEFTASEIKTAVVSSVDKVKNVPNAAVAAFKEGEAKIAYGPPINKVLNEDDKEFMIYAVADGTVTQVAQNEELGKFIRIKHDNEMESIYGTLSTITVKESGSVKKGQIIGSVANKGKKTLYFALLSGGKVVDPKEYIDF